MIALDSGWSVVRDGGLPPAPDPRPRSTQDEVDEWCDAVEEARALLERHDRERAREVLGRPARRRYAFQGGDRSPAPSPRRGSDPLLALAPPDYFAGLCGIDVPSGGAAVHCPLPGHDDRTPSCRVYAEPERGWYCFGCCRGGSIFDLAAELAGVEPRGAEFRALAQYLRERFL